MSLIAKYLFSQNKRCGIHFIQKKNLSSNPVVRVEQGKLKGSTHNLLDGAPYYSFKGIPYAQPPVGELRFKAPLPPKSWNNTYEALKHGPVCPQLDMITSRLIEGNENCLYLNVYTKSLAASDKLPVMVFIHGGAFLNGSGNSDVYGPDFLLQHDVILVTINYRLEVLGFLNLDIPEVPGNAGIKDQVAALKWIKTNIDKFGGNPDNITIFGESAGAASVLYHMISPLSKDLFNKVIAQSGTCLEDWALNKDLTPRSFRVGKILGKDTDNPKELLKFLQSLPAKNLAGLTIKTRTQDEKYRGLPIFFTPTIEKDFDNVESFLNVNPLDALATGNISKVPIIAGYNSAECISMLPVIIKKANYRSKHPEYLVPKEIMLNVSTEKMKEFGKRINKFYFGDKEFTAEEIEAQINMLSDVNFTYNNNRFTYLYSTSNQPIYKYVLDYNSDLNTFKKLVGMSHLKGTCHTEDLSYLFSSKYTTKIYKEQERVRGLVFTLTKLWTNFAKTGDPTPDQSLGVKWEPYTTSGEEYLHIGEPLTLAHAANRERTEFWNQLYCEAGLPHIDTHK